MKTSDGQLAEFAGFTYNSNYVSKINFNINANPLRYIVQPFYTDLPENILFYSKLKNHFYNLFPEFKMSKQDLLEKSMNKPIQFVFPYERYSFGRNSAGQIQINDQKKGFDFHSALVASEKTDTATLPLYACISGVDRTFENNNWVQRGLTAVQERTYNFSIKERIVEFFWANDSGCRGTGIQGRFVGYVVPPEKAFEHTLKYKQQMIPLISDSSAVQRTCWQRRLGKYCNNRS